MQIPTPQPQIKWDWDQAQALHSWDFPGSRGEDSTLSIQGAQVGSLVQELRSHKPSRAAKKKESAF